MYCYNDDKFEIQTETIFWLGRVDICIYISICPIEVISGEQSYHFDDAICRSDFFSPIYYISPPKNRYLIMKIIKK